MNRDQFFTEVYRTGGWIDMATERLDPETIKDKTLQRLWANFMNEFKHLEPIMDDLDALWHEWDDEMIGEDDEMYKMWRTFSLYIR